MEKVKTKGNVKKATMVKVVEEARRHRGMLTVKKDQVLNDLKDIEVLVYMAHNIIDTSHLKSIKKLTRYKDAAIARWLHISPRTLNTYNSTKKVLDKRLSEQVIMLRTVLEKGNAVFGNSEAFDTWLDTSNFFFDGKKPINFLDTTSGIRYIFDRLTALEYGDNV